jgi:hypothetical protein
MGPTIIFDKSSLQSLRPAELQEVNRYFYTVLPPILLLEILGDLSLEASKQRDPETLVAALTRKVPLTSSGVVPDFRRICILDLLTGDVPMNHRGPVADEVDFVFGENGAYTVIHPEMTAVERWCQRHFSDVDQVSALKLRERAQGTDFEGSKQTLPKQTLPELNCKAKTLQELQSNIDAVLTLFESQAPMLQWFLSYLGYDQPTNSQVFARWEQSDGRSLALFAPYAAYCLRIHLLFYLGMSLNLVGTRRSNIIDIEYLCYLPFAHIFSSGDKLHQQLAPLIHTNDQTFLIASRLQNSLAEISLKHETDTDAVPSENSVIGELWLKHLNRLPSANTHLEPTDEEYEKIMKTARPIFEVLRQREKESPSRRFPM